MKIIQRISLTFIGVLLLGVPSFASANFPDVSENHPYHRAIVTLQSQGVVEGELAEDGIRYYYPEKDINRAAYVTIALRGAGIDIPEVPEGQIIFDDVVGGVWYAGPIKIARELGIVSGDDGTNRFRPGDPVTAEEALKVALLASERTVRDKIDQENWYQPYLDYAAYYRLPEVNDMQRGQLISRGFMAHLMYELGRRVEDHELKENVQEGEASHYGAKFNGRGTANGEIYDPNQFTAAHRSLPFGTWVKVTRPETGDYVFVRINDRGPYSEGRIIDLSPVAFEALAPLSRGIIDVSIETFPEPPEDLSPLPPPLVLEDEADVLSCDQVPPFQSVGVSSFDNVTLDQPLSNIYVENQVLHLSGSVEGDQSVVTAFLVDQNDQQHIHQAQVEGGRFELFTSFPDDGIFKFGILLGNGGSAKVKQFHILPDTCLTESLSAELSAPENLQMSVQDGKTHVSWSSQVNDLTKLTFIQGNQQKSLLLKTGSELRLPLKPFQNFNEGDVDLQIQTAVYSGEHLLTGDEIRWGESVDLSFKATLHRTYKVDQDGLDLLDISQDSSQDLIELSFNPKMPVQSQAALILPNGLVERVDLSSPTHSPVMHKNGYDVFPEAAEEVNLNYLTDQYGPYVIEVNDTDGLAKINLAVYPEGVYPLLPNPADLSNRAPVDLGDDLEALSQQMLDLVNEERMRYGKGPLALNSTLSELGQFRAEDMAANDYFSHQDLNGNTVRELKNNYGIVQSVSENLAKEVTIELGMFGLVSSAIHLQNMLADDWKLAGFGFDKNNDGSYTMVQIFSDLPIDLGNLPELRQAMLDEINQGRTQPIVLDETLNDLAQSWSEKMSEEDFFEFTSPSGEAFFDLVAEANLNTALGAYLIGNSSFSNALEQVAANDQIVESRWQQVGFGLSQDVFGIKVTVLYSE